MTAKIMPSLRIVSKVVGKKPKALVNKTSNNKSTSESNDDPVTNFLPASITLGCQVKFPQGNKTSCGTVRFIGPTKFSSGLWCGIELKKPEGRNNGTVKGVKYFSCKFNYGIFVQADKVTVIDDKNATTKKDDKNDKILTKPLSPGKKKVKSTSHDNVAKDSTVRQLKTSIDDEWVVLGSENNDKKETSEQDVKKKSVDAIDAIEELEKEETEMKTRVKEQIEVNDSAFAVKIAESVNEDDNNNVTPDTFKPPDLGLMFYVIGRQRPGLSPRHRSCPALCFDEKSDEHIDDNVSNESQRSSTSEISVENINSVEAAKKKSSLTRKLSGIEKRIRNNSMRSLSPGTLRKSYSHGAVFPKENYVAFDKSIEKPKCLYALKRSSSDVTLYRRIRSAGIRTPSTPPILRKPWLRREKTAPEVITGDKVSNKDNTDDDIEGCFNESQAEDTTKKTTSEEDLDVFVDSNDLEDAKTAANDVLTQEAKVVEEDIISTQENGTLHEELPMPKQVEDSAEEDLEPPKQEDSSCTQEEQEIIQGKGLSLQEDSSKRNEKFHINKKLSTSIPHKGVSMSVKSTISSKPQRKYSMPLVKKDAPLPPTSTELTQSLSQIELSSAKGRRQTTTPAEKTRPKTFKKRVSDIVAKFEKTKDDEPDNKGMSGTNAQTSLAVAKMSIKANKIKQNSSSKPQDASTEKTQKKVSTSPVKRRSSQVSKEELVAKEALSQQYVDKEAHRKPSSPARTLSKTNTNTGRSVHTGADKRVPKVAQSAGTKETKEKTIDVSRRTNIPVKSTASKLEKSPTANTRSQPNDGEKEKIRDLKAKCENFESQIKALQKELKRKDLGMESFIVVIKHHIEMIESHSQEQMSLQEENNNLKNSIEDKSRDQESDKQTLKKMQEKLDQSARDFRKQIENLKKVHVKEIDEMKQEIQQEHDKDIEDVRTCLRKEMDELESGHFKEISDLKESNCRVTLSLKEEHQKNLKIKEEECAKISKEVEMQCQTEKEEVCLEYEDRIQDLQNQLELSQERCYDIEAKNQKLQEQLDNDVDTRMQAALSKYNNLPAELESLKAVIELKNDDIRKTRTQNMELQKKVEDLYELEKKYQKILQEKEALSVALQNKVKCERQLSVEKESLAANLEKESRKVKRLSMEKEELMWKFSNSSTLSLSSPSLNIDTPSPNGLESTPNSSRTFGRSLKTQSLYLPALDDEEYTVL